MTISSPNVYARYSLVWGSCYVESIGDQQKPAYESGGHQRCLSKGYGTVQKANEGLGLAFFS